MAGPAVVPHAVDTVDHDRILRFDRAERALHWANAILVLILLGTGLVLYVGSLSAVVGRRALIKNIHVISGLALPLPFLLLYAGPWRAGFRRDSRRLGRFLSDDWRWLRSRGKAAGLRLGKFNAGQKLNAIFVAGILPVMLLTGSIMYWNRPFSDAWRTGATFVHDWGFLSLLIVVTGHIAKALVEPVMLSSIFRGWVPARWAEHHRPRWHDEVVAAASTADADDDLARASSR
jgi:formate dehydrogenase subunit gamma